MGPELERSQGTLTSCKGGVLWDTVRKAGGISAEVERRPAGNPSDLHDVSLNNLPSAKQLGYHSAQQIRPCDPVYDVRGRLTLPSCNTYVELHIAVE
jgi:hypothetical protein